MKNNILKYFYITLASVLVVKPARAYSLTGDGGLDDAAEKTGHKKAGFADQSLPVIIGKIIQVVLGLLGVIFLGLIVYGGYRYMMAKGNDQEVEKAKNTIINAVIGAVIAFVAYAIVAFLMENLWSSVTQ